MRKDHNYSNLYNKISILTRKKFLYNDIKLPDNLISRLYLMLLIFAFVLRYLKQSKVNKKVSQNIYDFFFSKIELDFREMGHGDMSVNKKMKDIIKLFHEIVINCDKWEFMRDSEKVKYIMFLFANTEKNTNFIKLNEFFSKYSKNFEENSLYFDVKGIMKTH